MSLRDEYEEEDRDDEASDEAPSDGAPSDAGGDQEDTGDQPDDVGADDDPRGAEEPADDVDPEGETEDASDPVAPEDEAQAARVLDALRAAAGPLTVDQLHPEVNVEGTDGYVPAGRIERALGLLVERGLVQRGDGEVWLPVPAAKLALRRGELLQRIAAAALRHADEYQVDIREEGGDVRALARAGLVTLTDGDTTALAHDAVFDDDQGVWAAMEPEKARELLLRGTLTTVVEAIAECRTPGAPVVVTDGDAAEALAKERSSRQLAESERDGARKELGDARKALDSQRKQNGVMRAWFREANLPCPTEAAVQQPPPRDEFTHPVRVTWEVRGRMALLRKGLAGRLAEADGVLSLAKANHKAKAELLGTQIKTIDDQLDGMFFDAQVFRRVDVERGVAEIVCVDDETWVLEEKPLRSEQTKPKATAAAVEPETTAPEQPATAPAGAMTVLPADDAGDAQAAAPKAEQAPAEAPAPVIPEPAAAPSDKPKVLTKENIAKALVELADGMHPDDEMTLLVATEKIAAKLGVEAGTALGQLVKVGARKAHGDGTLRFWAAAGHEWIARMLKKAAPAPAPLLGPNAVLVALRNAGAIGLRKVEIVSATHLDEKVIDEALATLKERGAIKQTGKARGTRYVAAEHAGSASAEASV